MFESTQFMIRADAIENIICKKVDILFRPWYVEIRTACFFTEARFNLWYVISLISWSLVAARLKVQIIDIALKFDKPLGSSAAETRVWANEQF